MELNDPRFDRAEEHALEADRVEMGQHDAVFHLEAQAGQRIGGTVDAPAIRYTCRSGIIDVDDSPSRPATISLDQIKGSVVVRGIS
jgi:hypothetical protein